MLDKFKEAAKKVITNKHTGTAIFILGIVHAGLNSYYQEENRKEIWRQMIKEECGTLTKNESP